ncbi:MAG: hypothetical protein EOM50_08730 [Erysipelotrichia bacterium]|nr:hypothetical protein [Erysipelotrichia bacterium]
MRNMFLILTIVVSFHISSYAFVAGGTNFDIFGYPSHKCNKPYSKPFKPYSFNSQWEVDAYNNQVRQYNYEIQEFVQCIETYVDSAKNDIERITEEANKAIRETQY